jgi:hypothetical protein
MLLKELMEHWFCNKRLQINTHMPKKSMLQIGHNFIVKKWKNIAIYNLQIDLCVHNMCNAPKSRFEG